MSSLFKHFIIKIQPNLGKDWVREEMTKNLWFAKRQNQDGEKNIFFLYRKRVFFKEKWEWRIEKKTERSIFSGSRYCDWKEPNKNSC